MTSAPRIARGTAHGITRSRLVLALREAEERADHQLASDLRQLLGALTEVQVYEPKVQR